MRGVEIPEKLKPYVETNDMLDNTYDINEIKSIFQRLANLEDKSYINIAYRHLLTLAKRRIANQKFYVNLYKELVSTLGNRLNKNLEDGFFERKIKMYEVSDKLREALVHDDVKSFEIYSQNISFKRLILIAARFGAFRIFKSLEHVYHNSDDYNKAKIERNIVSSGSIEIASHYNITAKGNTLLDVALKFNQTQMFEYLRNHHIGEFQYSIKGPIANDDLRTLIKVSQNPPELRYPPQGYIYSARKGSMICLMYYIEYLDVSVDSAEWYSTANRSLITFAVGKDLLMLKYLLYKGASIYTKSGCIGPTTALQTGLSSSDDEIVQFLKSRFSQ